MRTPPSPLQLDARLVTRMETARAGIVLTFLEGLGLFAYVALTWSQPHRIVGAALSVFALALSLGLWLAPLERLLSDRWAPWTWLSWSLSFIVATGVGVAMDGGGKSPLVVVFVLLLMFAALSYPRRIAVLVCVADIATCFAVLQITHSGAAYTMLVLCTLIGAAGLCIWQVNRQERQERMLNALSRTDPLTGCLNRRAFDEQLAASVARHERNDANFALMVLDLDHFKDVNDTLGHAAGDELLQWTARTAAGCLRPGDVLARLGGDEFGVLLAGAGLEHAATIAERLTRELRERAPATAGLACCPADASDGDALYREADARLYAAKRTRAASPPRPPNALAGRQAAVSPAL